MSSLTAALSLKLEQMVPAFLYLQNSVTAGSNVQAFYWWWMLRKYPATINLFHLRETTNNQKFNYVMRCFYVEYSNSFQEILCLPGQDVSIIAYLLFSPFLDDDFVIWPTLSCVEIGTVIWFYCKRTHVICFMLDIQKLPVPLTEMYRDTINPMDFFVPHVGVVPHFKALPAFPVDHSSSQAVALNAAVFCKLLWS